MREITTDELIRLLGERKDVVLLDCRGPDYWRWDRIPGSVNLRWKYIDERAGQILPDKNVTIVTYCDGYTCPASAKSYEALDRLGYRSLLEYSGGITEWKAYGRATECDARYKIAPNVYAFPEQRFFDSPVHSYLIETADRVILIDGPQQLTEENEDFILTFGKPIDLILTHGATGKSAEEIRTKLQARVWMHRADENDEWTTTTPDRWLAGDEIFGSSLKVIHTPGHTPGSVSIYDSENKLLFTGDHVAATKGGRIRDVRRDAHAREGNEGRIDSLRKLVVLESTAILPFHYEQLRAGARKAIEDFLKGVGDG